jgi:hypothetical protein
MTDPIIERARERARSLALEESEAQHYRRQLAERVREADRHEKAIIFCEGVMECDDATYSNSHKLQAAKIHGDLTNAR